MDDKGGKSDKGHKDGKGDKGHKDGKGDKGEKPPRGPRTFSQFKREENRALAIERLEAAEARLEKVQKARA